MSKRKSRSIRFDPGPDPAEVEARLASSKGFFASMTPEQIKSLSEIDPELLEIHGTPRR